MGVIERIEAQQKGKEDTPAWMVGEQLKDILRHEPQFAELVEKDLDTVTLEAVEKKIKAWADEAHKKAKGSCVCVPPQVAEGIIREAYGLPGKEAEPKTVQVPAIEPGFLSLDDFL